AGRSCGEGISPVLPRFHAMIRRFRQPLEKSFTKLRTIWRFTSMAYRFSLLWQEKTPGSPALEQSVIFGRVPQSLDEGICLAAILQRGILPVFSISIFKKDAS
ncbi:MAG: hypothetical protein IKS68_06315, partial [Mailhella sp.]|nr:hypothetical protein [Mailhella sp.]